MTDTCRTCRFCADIIEAKSVCISILSDAQNWPEQAIGKCRKNAPAAIALVNQERCPHIASAHWPEIKADRDWCGEWEGKDNG